MVFFQGGWAPCAPFDFHSCVVRKPPVMSLTLAKAQRRNDEWNTKISPSFSSDLTQMHSYYMYMYTYKFSIFQLIMKCHNKHFSRKL